MAMDIRLYYSRMRNAWKGEGSVYIRSIFLLHYDTTVSPAISIVSGIKARDLSCADGLHTR